MFFRGLFRPWARLISKNISSLMFPREVMEELGGWVEARAGADTELLRRLETLYGSRAREGWPSAGRSPSRSTRSARSPGSR